MTVSRIKNLLLKINNSQASLFFLTGNIEDIFCDKNLTISNLRLELYNSFKNVLNIERITFVEKDDIYFLDDKSYKSYLGLEVNDLTNGPLGNISILNSKINQSYLQGIFKEAFIEQLNYFLSQNIKSVYIIDSYSFNNYFSNYNYLTDSNNLIIIIDKQLNSLKISLINENKFEIIELDKPDKSEVFNLLNNLRINNGLEAIYDIDELTKKIESLTYIYSNLKDHHNICLYLKNIFVKEERIYKSNTDWLEL